MGYCSWKKGTGKFISNQGSYSFSKVKLKHLSSIFKVHFKRFQHITSVVKYIFLYSTLMNFRSYMCTILYCCKVYLIMVIILVIETFRLSETYYKITHDIIISLKCKVWFLFLRTIITLGDPWRYFTSHFLENLSGYMLIAINVDKVSVYHDISI